MLAHSAIGFLVKRRSVYTDEDSLGISNQRLKLITFELQVLVLAGFNEEFFQIWLKYREVFLIQVVVSQIDAVIPLGYKLLIDVENGDVLVWVVNSHGDCGETSYVACSNVQNVGKLTH